MTSPLSRLKQAADAQSDGSFFEGDKEWHARVAKSDLRAALAAVEALRDTATDMQWAEDDDYNAPGLDVLKLAKDKATVALAALDREG
jgi:hypothetical protein